VRIDQNGTYFADYESACAYARQLVRELQDGGFNDPGARMVIQDEAGNILHSISL
jgi:hypothetical protein